MHAPDFDRFRKLLDDIALLLPPKDPLTDAMIQGYWNALKDLPIEIVEACGKAHKRFGKFFPKPFELRPKGEKAKQDLPSEGPARNHIRDYWRSTVANEAAAAFGHEPEKFQELLQAHPETLGRPLRELLDELETQDRRDGRTVGQHRYATRICEDLARRFPELRAVNAMQLPPPPRETAERLDGF